MYFVLVYIAVYFSFAAVTPYLSLLVRGLEYSPKAVGILLGVFEGAGMGGPFLFGCFADRTGRYKPGLLISAALVVVSAIPLILFRSPLLSGLFLAVMAVGFRSTIPLLDAVTTVNQGKSGNYGKIRTVGSVSFIAMALFLQWTPALRPDNSRNIGVVIALCSALILIFVTILPPRYARIEKPVPAPAAPKLPRKKTGLRPSLLIPGIIIIALSRLAMTPVYTFFPLYLTESLHWNVVSLMFALAAAAEVPCMYISQRLIRRFGALRLLAASAAAIGVRLAVYAFCPFKPALLLAQLLHSLCYGVFHPAAIALVSGCLPPERRALGMSLYLSLGTGFPAFIGNIIGGFIVDHAGYQALFISFMIFPAMVMGLYFFVAVKRQSVI
ncbi:MAG: MFS transporter [Treponema sp.]|jgi:PPP family 3-phenylpropionic acid transporter|nr:MFS transporter [Treponema sp.]